MLICARVCVRVCGCVLFALCFDVRTHMNNRPFQYILCRCLAACSCAAMCVAYTRSQHMHAHNRYWILCESVHVYGLCWSSRNTAQHRTVHTTHCLQQLVLLYSFAYVPCCSFSRVLGLCFSFCRLKLHGDYIFKHTKERATATLAYYHRIYLYAYA